MSLEPWFLCLIGMATVIGAILGLRLHPFLALLLAGWIVLALTPLVPETYREPGALAAPGKRLAEAFGSGCGKVGILIALASVIGQCLLQSRAAERIVQAIVSAFGEKRAPLAFLTSGFVLGIPVYFDTVFYLLLPLVREFARKAPDRHLPGLLAVVAGATMAHSLVPPTPGPLLVAGQLDVSLGVMIPAGIVLGLLTAASGYGYALWANRRWPLPPPSAPLPSGDPSTAAPLPLPPLGLAILPILLPIVLIVAATASQLVPGASPPAWLTALGEQNLAMGIGATAALLLLARTHRGQSDALPSALREALSVGGVIILITAAGSAFGDAMKVSGVAKQLAESMGGSGSHLLWVAFGLTALVRVAQGSATVAMITAVGIIQPLMAEITLPYHPVYLALAIGCGSKPGPWMNDSGFWIISRMTGMSEVETLRTFSAQLTVMGFVGFACVLLSSWIFPLA